MKKKRFGFLLLCMLTFCMMLPLFASADETDFNINKTRLILYKGGKEKLKTTGAVGTVTWSSSNKKVATVTKTGWVKAKKAGVAYIYAKNNGKTVRCRVRVKTPSISLDETELELEIGETEELFATVVGPSSEVKWQSSRKSVASVDKYGTVTAKKAGTATITATANGVSAKCKVTVIKIDTGSIVLNQEELYLTEDDTYQFSWKVTGVTQKYTIQWTVDRPSIMSVSQSGLLTAYEEGYGQVTATVMVNGKSTGIFDTCQVEIDKREEDKHVTFVELENRTSGGYEYGYLHGYNQAGEEVWRSDNALYAVPGAQYFHASAVTDVTRDRVYLVESSRITRYNMQTGIRDTGYGIKYFSIGGAPYGCLDSLGNLYVVNAGDGSHQVKKITAEGYLVCAQDLITAFYEPYDPQILSNGNLRIRGSGNYSSVLLRTSDLFVIGYY